MRRKLPDVSTTQLVASGLATAGAAVGASYLGVYGTIIGAAFMSVVSTAGAAIGQHYLDQGKEQIRTRAHPAFRPDDPDPTRTVVWPSDPNATRIDPSPAETVADEVIVNATRNTVDKGAAWRSTVEWARRRWVVLAVSSAAIFALVMGGISLIELGTGAPIGKNGDKGLTVTKVFGGEGGGHKRTPTPTPSGDRSHEPEKTPATGTPKATPTETGGTPRTTPPTTPSQERPTDEPTVPPTTTKPAPTSTPTPGKTTEGGQDAGQRDAPRD
ncbi:hypothetical protein [Spirillospora sp. CA-294931]|uniref:hypothetical protein n=1 Tax=Spirillospora sp. CA-294931 TaxID=3240042 RepID=UPI003D8D2718